jgi:hypothetical protein
VLFGFHHARLHALPVNLEMLEKRKLVPLPLLTSPMLTLACAKYGTFNSATVQRATV